MDSAKYYRNIALGMLVYMVVCSMFNLQDTAHQLFFGIQSVLWMLKADIEDIKNRLP